MFKKILSIFDKKQKWGLLGLLFLILISSGLELLGVSAILPLVSVISDPDMLNENEKYRLVGDFIGIKEAKEFVLGMAIFLAVVYIVKNLFLIWMNYQEYKYIFHNKRIIAMRLVNCYVYQDYNFHINTNIAEIQRNVDSDVGNFFTAMLSMLHLITELLVCTVLFVYLMITDIGTTLSMGLLMVLMMALYFCVFKKQLQHLGEENRHCAAEGRKSFLQMFNGIKEIKTGNREKYFIDTYEYYYKEGMDVMVKQSVLGYIPKPVAEMVLISGLLIFIAIRIYHGAAMSTLVPILSVFAVAAFRVLPSFSRISGDIGVLMFNKPSIDALYEDLKEVEKLNKKITEIKEERREKMTLSDSLSLCNVSFSYPSKPEVRILDKINICIPSKSSVALIGPSGAGKTTIADVILGLYRPDEGEIYADKRNVHDDINAWHRSIGYIPQNIYLIDDTIRANVAFGVPREDIDDERVWKALEKAQLKAFIASQPDGLDSNVGDRGVRISGGQRQHIGIARALYTDPELLILDEATSALDNDTEQAVMDAIYHLSGKITMIVIAHRLTTIKSCDRIYRIEKGKAEQISFEEAIQKPDK